MNANQPIRFCVRYLPLLVAVAALAPWKAPGASYGQVDTNYARPTFKQVAYPIRVVSDGRGGLLWTFYNGGNLDGGNGSRIGNVLRTSEFGALDASFATGPLFSETMGTVVQTDGRVLVGAALAGDVSSNGVPRYHVFRLLTNGVLDATYQSPIFGYFPRFMALQTDGKLVVGGSSGTGALESQSTALTNTVRLNPNGSLDNSFNAPVLADAARLAPVFAPPVLDRQGRILLAGAFSTVDGVQYPRIVRLQTNGTVDASFAPTGFAVNSSSYIRGMVLQPDGKIVIAGYYLKVTGNPTNYPLLRLNDNGTLDSNFTLVDPIASGLTNPFSTTTTSPIRLLKMDSQGRILTAGFRIARFNSNGSLDHSFQRLEISDPDGGYEFNLLGGAYWLEVLSDDSVLVPLSGPAAAGGVPVKSAFRLTSAGTLDTSFAQPSLEGEVYPSKLALQRDGKALVWGNFDSVNGTSHSNVVRLNLDGTPDPTYNFVAESDVVGVQQAAAAPDGQLYAVLAHGLTRYYWLWDSFVRLRADGSMEPEQESPPLPLYKSYYPNPGLFVQDGHLLFWWNDEQSVVDGWFPLWRYKPDGGYDDDFTAPTNRLGSFNASNLTAVVGRMDILAMQPDRRLLAAITYDATNYSFVRLQANGAFDLGFVSPTIRGGPSQVDTSPVYGLPGGWYTQVIVTTAGPSPFSAAAVQADGRILLAGSFRQLGGVGVAGLARLNPDGSLDASFPGGSGAANASTERPFRVDRVVLDGLGRIWITGDFNRFNGVPVKGLVRLTPDGAVDNSFTPGPAFFHYGNPYLDPERQCDLALASDGGVYLLGTFRRNAGEWPDALHLLLGDAAPRLGLSSYSGGAGAALSLHLAEGITYKLQGSTNLHHWSDLGVFTGTNSPQLYQDSAASRLDSRFYRLRAP